MTRRLIILTIIAALALPALAQADELGAITEYPLPESAASPMGITVGADNALWFAQGAKNKIGRVTTAGTPIDSYPVITTSSFPRGITAGPDGNVWFTEFNGNNIGKITPAGVVTEYPIPTAASKPKWIAAGPDGALWFTEQDGNKIGRITTSGVITDEFVIPTVAAGADKIVAGPDGNMWFSECSADKVGRITMAGTIDEFALPAGTCPSGISAGSDGNIWVGAAEAVNTITKISPTGSIIDTYTMAGAKRQILGMALGPDGAVWFAEQSNSKVGRITSDGTITEYATLNPSQPPGGIVAGPDGNVWFTENLGNAVAKVGAGGATVTVTKSGDGSGTVTSSPGSLVCGATCSELFYYATVVSLTASADSDSTFAGFSGDCSGVSCSVAIDKAKAVTATFTKNPDPPKPPVKPTLTVSALKAKVTKKSVYLTSEISSSAAGSLAQAAEAGKKRWCQTSKKLTAPGTVTLKCNLGKKGRSYLKKRKLVLTVTTGIVDNNKNMVAKTNKLTIKKKR